MTAVRLGVMHMPKVLFGQSSALMMISVGGSPLYIVPQYGAFTPSSSRGWVMSKHIYGRLI